MLDILDFTDKLTKLLEDADYYKYSNTKLKLEIQKLKLEYELQQHKIETEMLEEEGVI